MSEQPEFFTYTRDEFIDEFVHPDDRSAVEEARQKRALQVRAEYLTEMRKKTGKLGPHRGQAHMLLIALASPSRSATGSS
jgi:hypothetical protein